MPESGGAVALELVLKDGRAAARAEYKHRIKPWASVYANAHINQALSWGASAGLRFRF